MTNKVKTPPEDRIYDDNDGFLLRAASVCVKNKNESEVRAFYIEKLVAQHSNATRNYVYFIKIFNSSFRFF